MACDAVVVAAGDRARRGLGRTFALGILAGAEIGMGGMLMSVVRADAPQPAASALLSGLCFSVGLYLVFMTGAELFTGDVMSVMACWERGHRHVSPGRLMAVLACVYAGNLVGSVMVSAMLAWLGFDAVWAIAAAKCAVPPMQALLRGVMCNVLVCMAVWTRTESFDRSAVGTLVCAAVPVTTFVACGFEHCVANMMFMPYGVMTGAVGLVPAVANIAVVTVGNVIGGLAVAVMAWVTR